MPRSQIILAGLVFVTTATVRAEPPPATSEPATTTSAATQPTASQPSGASTAPASPGEPLQRFQDALEALVERIGPTVVAIQTDRRPSPGEAAAGNPLAWVASGSGVIVRGDGMVLTSQHVIEGAIAIHVTLNDGRFFRARRIAADPRADLAIIQIGADHLAAAELGDVREVRRGQIVLALGNPLGLAADGQAAVSLGIVSAIGRPLPGALGKDEDRHYGDMIQTSAAINPGHSGGPLVDIPRARHWRADRLDRGRG
jgi:S1-C subfamily serine protease